MTPMDAIQRYLDRGWSIEGAEFAREPKETTGPLSDWREFEPGPEIVVTLRLKEPRP